MPQAVDMTSSGYLEVNSDPVFWTMLNVIKELKQQKDIEIASVNKKLIATDAEIASLKQELAVVKTSGADRMAALEGKVEMLVRAIAAGNAAFSMVEQNQ